MSKEELEKQIAKEIDFLSDHWVNGDDKPPFSFGGWRGEVIATLANLFERSCKEREKALLERVKRKLMNLMPEKRAQDLAERLSAYQDERFCSLCGADPVMQRSMILKVVREELEKK